MLTDSTTGWHRETPKHLAHIMRWGRSTGASGGRDGLVVGGATGICQSSCSPQRTSWTLLSPSVCERWQLQTEDNVCGSAATYLTGRVNCPKAETDNTAQPCSTDEKQTLIKPLCTYTGCWWSVSSSWQITTQIRHKEDLTHGFCFAHIFPGNLLWTSYRCNSPHSKSAAAALWRPHRSLLLRSTPSAGGLKLLRTVHTNSWPSSVLSSITQGYARFKRICCCSSLLN